MLYFIVNINRQLVAILSDHDVNSPVKDGTQKLCRWDFPTFSDAQAMAEQCNMLQDGKTYIPTDAGEWTSPRYDVIAAPVVGADVSRYFNGDGYPAGKIVAISKTLKKITASDGTATWEFYRVRQSGTWLNQGTWSMIAGHNKDRNPSF